MTTLSDEPKITSMAHALGIHQGDRVSGIKDYCRAKVRQFIADAGGVSSIDELEKLICERLNITVVEVWTSEELDALIEQRARREKDIAFAALRRDLDSETFATLIRCRRKLGESEDHYVTVIDCREEKGARRFFTRWHEIAHVLTMFEQLQLPLHRSTVEKDPVERMMDMIAGDIGFYDPLFTPLLFDEIQEAGYLTFSSVENVRRRYSSSASFEATLNACVSRLEHPVLFVQAEMRFKRNVERALESGQFDLFPTEKPAPQLRVSTAISNEAGRDGGLIVHPNMRVAEKSIIASVYARTDEFVSRSGNENLNWWSTSSGKVLRNLPVRVEAMKVKSQVWALLTPLE